jgi:hypothetical protein
MFLAKCTYYLKKNYDSIFVLRYFMRKDIYIIIKYTPDKSSSNIFSVDGRRA